MKSPDAPPETSGAHEGAFEAVGLTPSEERIYRAILRWPRGDLAELASLTGTAEPECSQLVARLEEKGLVSRTPEPGSRLVPAPPDLAVDALVYQRQEELERARAASRGLMREFRSRAERGAPTDIVEVVRGRAAILQRWDQLQRTADREILAFASPPYAAGVGVQNELEVELLSKGIRYRVVYARAALEIPAEFDNTVYTTTVGEEARVLPTVPMKLDIADHSLALVPLEIEEPGVESALLVHASPLLEALRWLFESLWERAVPLREGQASVPETEGGTELKEDDRTLLLLLASGMQDQAVAHHLGCSLTTARRRVTTLMRRAGAQTRFQIGLQAAKQGWL